MKNLKPNTVIGLAMVIGGGLLMAVALNALFSIGSCGSSSTFISAHPCPAGTGARILELMGGIILAVIGIIISGEFALAFGGFFTGVGAYSLIHALGSHGLGTGSKTGGLIMGITFLAIGIPTLLAGLAGRSSSSSRTPIDVNSLTAGSRLTAAGMAGSSYTPVAPTIIRAPGATAAKPAGDPLDKLKELADLKDRGVLSETEFQAQKAKLLSS
jgi:Short C-terminal domain